MELICIGRYEHNGLIAYVARQQIIYNREQSIYIDITALADKLKLTKDRLNTLINSSIQAKNSVSRIKMGNTDRFVFGIKTTGLNSLYSILTEQVDGSVLRLIKDEIKQLVSNIAGVGR
ncbi:hypothetical protein GXP70_00570 [Paenibacillus lycopersici]|uniref:Uncharacterized protein n=1 Tax=Paenibacillus lycopersici TaxID=2704462 RepID=A0A6C0FWQ4_9BACL|nr:hypothetical protein [Paenibacillus lycopersici]QHT58620.1 hypothetical protein GXP70_00570 [Paenibacillus lycopersici]